MPLVNNSTFHPLCDTGPRMYNSASRLMVLRFSQTRNHYAGSSLPLWSHSWAKFGQFRPIIRCPVTASGKKGTILVSRPSSASMSASAAPRPVFAVLSSSFTLRKKSRKKRYFFLPSFLSFYFPPFAFPGPIFLALSLSYLTSHSCVLVVSCYVVVEQKCSENSTRPPFFA